MFNNFSNGDVTINALGGFEQAMLLQALSANNQNACQQIINTCGGGTIRGYFFKNEEGIPNYLMFQQGLNSFFVFLGIRTFGQAGEVLGGWFLGNPNDGKGLVNAYAYKNYQNLKPHIVLAFPFGLPGGNIYIMGHSYGSMVAQLMAQDVLASATPDRVHLLGFGPPKVFIRPTGRTMPSDFALYANDTDGIAFLPYSGENILQANLTQIVIAKQVPYWVHAQAVNQGFSDGSTIIQQPSYFDYEYDKPNVDISGGPGHKSTEYLRRCYNAIKNTSLPSQDKNLTTLCLNLLDADIEDARLSNITTANYINPATLNDTFFLPAQTQPITSDNLDTIQIVNASILSVVVGSKSNIAEEREIIMASIPTYFKVTLIINAGPTGRSESHILAGATDWTDAKNKALQLAQRRAVILGNQTNAAAPPQGAGSAQIQFLRLSDALNPRNSLLIDLSSSNLFGSPSSALDWGCDSPSVALSVRIKGTNVNAPNPDAFAAIQMNYSPDVAVKNDQFQQGVTPTGSGYSMSGRIKDYLDELSNGTRQWGFMGLSTAQPPQPVNSISLNINKLWQLNVPAHGYITGDKIRLTRVNVKGFNGTYIINKIDADNFTLASQPPIDLDQPSQGTVRRVQFAPGPPNNGAKALQFYRYQLPTIGSWVPSDVVSVRKKNPGRPFSKQSFRRRVRRLH